MEASAPAGRLNSCLDVLSSSTARPELFLSVQEGLAGEFISLTKTLYDFHKALGSDVISGSPLKELVVENFDEEQIWQQLELQNNAALGHFQEAVAKSVKEEADISLLEPLEEEDEEEEKEESDEEQMDAEDQTEEEAEIQNDHLEEESDQSGKKGLKGTETHSFSDEDSDIDFDIDELEQRTKRLKSAVKKAGETSIVDDRFFKLYEMEAALDAAEKKESKAKDDKDEDDDDIDYFEEIISEDDEDDGEEEFGNASMMLTKSARDLKYKDYFDPVDDHEGFTGESKDNGEDEQSEGADDDDDGEEEDAIDEMEDDEDAIERAEKDNLSEPSKRVKFSLPYDSDGEEDTHTFQGKAEKSPEVKSSFEKRQEKLSEKIKKLESELLTEKPWQLKGEVTAQKRPENSLLEEMLLFDHAVKMAPMITEETTLELEDIIKRRIKDQAWDDVVRKEKPKEDPFEYKKRLTLDHEKSKLSLAEIYEQEYLKLNQNKTEEEEKPEHAEIKKMMDSLFLKLDALSNFHFTPKPPVPEVKIVSNLPAITMEEVAPVNVSDAALLAPEEIKEKNKGGEVKADAEKSSTDKKRERRKKKLARRIKLREKEKRQKLLEKKAEGNPRLSKKASAAELKKLTKEGRTSLLKDDGKDKALKSSKAFFSQLQDQVKMQITEAKKSQRKPKKRALSAQKLKL
uniref:U3 small nucleolar ribonucleoprotein protein MPP10 n=1 Tax=Anolis carolinensis TaxID=28377 RepID=H9G6I7_ANOCA|nr:PREDICTED: U3 small nucleolar ribonucleoprotein protein MPP10 [Anolis carolinensis]|eukprot:XP_003226974.1 PREDICTED: U3 small nucleolar ribonucleoprotein protein MPP10 [Anolis carolinensis]